MKSAISVKLYSFRAWNIEGPILDGENHNGLMKNGARTLCRWLMKRGDI